mgnify:CR=1 FL=1
MKKLLEQIAKDLNVNLGPPIKIADTQDGLEQIKLTNNFKNIVNFNNPYNEVVKFARNDHNFRTNTSKFYVCESTTKIYEYTVNILSRSGKTKQLIIQEYPISSDI